MSPSFRARYYRQVGWKEELAGFWSGVADAAHGATLGHYEREVRLQTAELSDLFLLLCYMEAVGLPNPATLYMLEIHPYLLEQFHLWHTRMGIPHSPLDSMKCC